MKTVLSFTAIFLAAGPICAESTPPTPGGATLTDVQLLKISVDKTLEELKESSATQRTATQDFQKKLQDLDTKLNDAKSDSDKLTAMSQRLRVLEDFSAKRAQAQRDQLRKRYELGLKGLDQMIKNITVIRWSERLTHLENRLDLTTSPWEDDDFRNAWDRVQTGGTVLGLAAAGIAVFASGGTQKGLAVAGVSTAGLSQLAGLLGGRFGIAGKDAGKIQQKMERLELSRRAYEAIKERESLLTGYMAENEAFKTELRTFRDVSYATADTDQKRTEAVEKLAMYFDRFRGTLDQVPTLLAQYDSVLDQFSRDELKSEAIKKSLDSIRDEVNLAKIDYKILKEEVLSFEHEVQRVLRFPDSNLTDDSLQPAMVNK